MSFEGKEKTYVDILLEQIEAQTRYIDEVRAIKHDMYAHMMVVKHYIGMEKYEAATEYLSKLMGFSIFQQGTYEDVGNEVVSALLTARKFATGDKVKFLVEGVLPQDIWVDNVDLCVLVSNLISNSVEACERLDYEESVVRISFKTSEKSLTISISNPIEGDVNVETFGNCTSKEDTENHGYGMKNIKRIVSKYNGKMNINCADGLVLVKIDLPHVAQDTSL